MELREVYGRFMDSAEHGYFRVLAYNMTREFYVKLLNSDLRKSFYYNQLYIYFQNAKVCEIMINGYPIVLTSGFKEIYDFEEILISEFEQLLDDCFNEA